MLHGERRKDMKMLEILYIVATTLVLFACGVEFAMVDAASDGKSIPPIYWNTSAPIFKNQKDYIQNVKIGQKMDIICPMNASIHGDGALYFILYQVSKENYENCNTHGQKRLLTCDAPQREKKYTFLFEDITPSPWGLTFRPKETYYFISTSDGTRAGINNQKGGACTEKQMKLRILVQPRDHKDDSIHVPVKPNLEPVSTSTSIPKYVRTKGTYKQSEKERDSEEDKNENHDDIVNSNGLVIGVVLGACAVLFIVLLGFLGYKVYRKRRNVKKYQSPGISAGRTGTPQAQVTLLPISSHQATHLRTHTARSQGTHHRHIEIQDLPAPPPYSDTMMSHTMDHAGSTMEV